jgi:hypothetical protein
VTYWSAVSGAASGTDGSAGTSFPIPLSAHRFYRTAAADTCGEGPL